MYNINNFVIDHSIRGIMTNLKDGSFMWGINQIADPSLKVTTESNDKVDALGVIVNTFFRGKAAEFSANNSLFDLGLYAAQNGTEKKIATTNAKQIAPCFEPIIVENGVESVSLKHTPTSEIKEIHELKGDGTFGTRYEVSTAPAEDKFVYSEGSITLPKNLKPGTELMVIYEYETENAVSVTVDGINFPKNGKFVLEVLGHDVCDPDTMIHAFLVFPNAKLDANVDISFTTEGNHPFTIKAFQNYCDSKKVLCSLVFPQED